MAARSPLAAVVLAGGASRRMGRDKATMPSPGSVPGHARVTMVERTVEVLRARCAPVFVVAAPGQQLPELQAEVLRDEVRGVGPLLATGRGLRAAGDAGLEWAFVCAVDMPRLTAEIIDDLVAGTEGVDIVLPWDGREHYLAGIYRTSLADPIEALVAAGARSMRSLTDSVVTQRIVLDPTPALSNANSADDLATI